MIIYHTWYLSLAAFLLVASPWSAQAQKEASVKMIFAVWKDTTGAERAVKYLNPSTKDQIEAYAVLIKDKNGTVEPRLRHHKSGSALGLQATQTLDSAIARLSDPATDSASGYASERTSRLSEEDLKKVVGMFNPNESALLLLSPKSAASEVKKAVGMGAQGHPEIVELEVK
jgi:hypothetical protein